MLFHPITSPVRSRITSLNLRLSGSESGDVSGLPKHFSHASLNRVMNTDRSALRIRETSHTAERIRVPVEFRPVSASNRRGRRIFVLIQNQGQSHCIRT